MVNTPHFLAASETSIAAGKGAPWGGIGRVQPPRGPALAAQPTERRRDATRAGVSLNNLPIPDLLSPAYSTR